MVAETMSVYILKVISLAVEPVFYSSQRSSGIYKLFKLFHLGKLHLVSYKSSDI